MERAAAQVPLWKLGSYSLPAIGLAMLGGPIVVFLPNFYATEVGLSLNTVGVIFLVARFWDGASDLLVGIASDRTVSRWGQRKPWLFAATPVLCATVYAILLPPDDVGPAYLFVMLIATYTAWTAVQVPYMAWGAAISSNFSDRSRVFGLREVGMVLGSLGTVLLPFAVTGIPSPPLTDVLSVLGLSIIAILGVAVPIALLFGPDAPHEAPAEGPTWRAVARIRENGPLVRVLTISFLATTGLYAFTAGVLFYLNSVLRMQAVFLQLLLIQQVATILFVPLVLAGAARYGRHRALAVGCFGAGVGFVSLSILPAEQFVATAITLVLIGCSAAALFVMIPALAADAIDYGTLRRLGAQNGLCMSVLSLVTKLGTALAVGVTLPLLQFLGFDATKPVTSDGIAALSLASLYLPAMIVMAGGLLAWSHPVDRKRHELIVKRLGRRAHQQTHVS